MPEGPRGPVTPGASAHKSTRDGRAARQPLSGGPRPLPCGGAEGFLCLTHLKRDFEAIHNGSVRYGGQRTFGKDNNLGAKQIYLQAIKIRESQCEVFSKSADGSIWKGGCGMPHLLTVLGASHVLASGSVGASPQGSVWPWAGRGLTSRAVGEKGRPCLAGVPRTPLMAVRFICRWKTGERPLAVTGNAGRGRGGLGDRTVLWRTRGSPGRDRLPAHGHFWPPRFRRLHSKAVVPERPGPLPWRAGPAGL